MINITGNEKKQTPTTQIVIFYVNYYSISQFKGFSLLNLKLIPENLRSENPLWWKCQQ